MTQEITGSVAVTGNEPHSGPWFHPHALCEGCDKQFADWQAMADEVRVLRESVTGEKVVKDEYFKMMARLNMAIKSVPEWGDSRHSLVQCLFCHRLFQDGHASDCFRKP